MTSNSRPRLARTAAHRRADRRFFVPRGDQHGDRGKRGRPGDGQGGGAYASEIGAEESGDQGQGTQVRSG